MFEKSFFNLETVTCHYIQNITLQKNLVCLAITVLNYKDHTDFYQFLLPLSGDVNVNPVQVQISLAVNTSIWEPFSHKGLHFLNMNIKSLLPKIDELKCIANKTKKTIIGIAELKEVSLPGYDVL